MAADRGVTVRTVDIRRDDVTLDLEDLESKLERADEARRRRLRQQRGRDDQPGRRDRRPRPRGRRLDLRRRRRLRAARPDRRPGDLDTDFLVCSAYKWFGPHLGALYGKAEVFDRLPAFKVRPAARPVRDRDAGLRVDRRDARRDRLPARRRARRTATSPARRGPPTRASGGASSWPGWSPSPTTSARSSRALIDGLEAHRRRDDPRHHRPGPLRRARPDRLRVDRRRPPARRRGTARSRGHLHLGRRLLRDRAHRAPRQGRVGRRPAARARPLQHRRPRSIGRSTRLAGSRRDR